jgi:hypothetical protein
MEKLNKHRRREKRDFLTNTNIHEPDEDTEKRFYCRWYVQLQYSEERTNL